jgi:hypothetical protein
MKYAPVLFVVMLAVACKSAQRGSAGEVFASPKALAAAFESNLPLERAYHIRGSGTFEQNGQSNSFRFDLRMQRDSVLFMELMDPILGIKAVRIWVTPDTVVAVNLLERWFVREPVNRLLERFPLGLDYQALQGVLLARPAFGWGPQSDSLALNDRTYQVFHQRTDGSSAVYRFAGPVVALEGQQMTHPRLGEAQCRYEYAEEDPKRFKKVLLEARQGQQTVALRLKYDVVRTQDVVVPPTLIPPGYVVKAL